MKLFNVVRELSGVIDREFPITVALVFLRVAEAGPEGVLQATVMRELRLPESVLTRIVQSLSDGKQLKPGLGLITRAIDSADGRHRILRVTTKGEALARAAEPKAGAFEGRTL
jgi:DNA-binding MarR family transcriptional regulator